MRRSRLIFVLPLLPAPAFAGSGGDVLGSTLTMLFGLGLVLAALYGLLMVLKRVQQRNGSSQAALRIIGATAVGARERVVLLEVADRVLVLGVAPGRITTLESLDAASVPRTPAAPPPSAGEFQTRLAEILRGVRHAR